MVEATYHNHITDDLDAMLFVLPEDIQTALRQIGRRDDLLEVILDLGRIPTARYTDGEAMLRDTEVSSEEIEYVAARVGDFDADNRAGIARTLHRIAAIRNRKRDIVGLTCRVGRAVYGTIAIIQDIIESGKCALLLGRPGVGKTTMLREAARVLAEKKRVIVVDTSNEIGGDGDIPHPAVGRARRMQVEKPSLQHEVMIEAVENHNPEVIIIDEIGRELEALAARTIAERGVQLIATAHGNTLDNLLLNPTLSDLVGGIESVTLSDEEARRRKTQKSILERRSPPTFDLLIEIQDRQRLLIRHSVAESVDGLLRGKPLRGELRYRDSDGEIHTERSPSPSPPPTPSHFPSPEEQGKEPAETTEVREPTRIFPYGVARNRLEQAAHRMHTPICLVDEMKQADVLITIKRFYRKRPSLIVEAERRGLPIYVLRANTLAQMEVCLKDLFDQEEQPQSLNPLHQALQEAEEAIQRIQKGAPGAELAPQNAYVRRLQHEMARDANLSSRSRGNEPHRRVWVYQGKNTR